MPFMTKCPGCGKGLQVPDAAAGKRVKCPECEHVWQVAPPAAARSAIPAAHTQQATPPTSMTKCPGCGRDIQLPASAAGKRVKCPACSHVWQVPGGLVDAEAVPEAPSLGSHFDDLMSDTYPLATDFGRAPGAAAAAEPPRRPCPMCGEMIVIGAAKCRYCDAIFDETLKRTEKKRKRRRESSPDDEDLTGLEWVLCILCSGIGCILGVVYLIQGKSKGGKMIGIAVLAAIVKNVIVFLIQAANQAPHGLR